MLVSIASDTICKAGGQSLHNQSKGLSAAELIKAGQVELLVLVWTRVSIVGSNCRVGQDGRVLRIPNNLIV